MSDPHGTGWSRRAMLAGIAAGAAAPLAALAAPLPPGIQPVPLWPGRPPGSPAQLPSPRIEQRSQSPGFDDRWLTGIGTPGLVVHRPPTPNGAAVLVIPGGGYGFLAYDNEGEEQARWLNARGLTAFILLYRLPGEGWAGRATMPLADAQRAMRVIRSRSAEFGIDAGRVATLGFSAGGHLAGSLATRHAERVYAPVDAGDRLSARPDVAGLIYPVVSLDAAFTHGGSRDNLLGEGADAAARRAASVELRVDADTPPLFLAHAADDGLVPVANSLALYGAMLAGRRPAELHAFEEGGHGFGARIGKDRPASAWPALFAAYATRHGVFPG